MQQRFSGKTIIITGSSSGIGEGCARRFSAEGANVVLAARRMSRLEKVAQELDPSRTLVAVTDVTKRGDVETMVMATVERFGKIDVLVSNAGKGLLKDFADTTIADWRSMMEVNLDSSFHCAQAALPYLKATHGCIVHIASASGLGGDWNLSAYNAAKGGLVNFTRALALDLGKYSIRVNAVAPSLTLSEASSEAIRNANFVANFNNRMALNGYATAEDVAGATTFLASEDARFITGAILSVDGGVTASSGQPDLLKCGF